MLYSTMLKSLMCAVLGAPPDLSEGQPGWGLVLLADGVGGFDLCGASLCRVIAAEKLPLTVKVVPWGHGFGAWHKDLTRTANRDARAAEVADEVRAFREANPQSPVFLIGKSGGTGVIVKALEQLPGDSVESVVFLAPALSPRYDLTRALSAVRRELVVFWSPLDVIVLGAGTRVFGTIDRVKGVSAGLVGFKRPAAQTEPQARQYAKLRQVRWGPRMARTGYLGGHVGPDTPAFLRRYVVPLLDQKDTGRKPDPTVPGNPPGDQARPGRRR